MDQTVLEIAGALVAAGSAAGWLVLRRRSGGAVAPLPPAVPEEAKPVGGRGVRAALVATARRFRDRLDVAFAGSRQEVLEGIEEALLTADVGMPTTAALLDGLRARLGANPDPERARAALRDQLSEMLRAAGPTQPSASPWVVLVTGINGVGKTTTIGKLAALHRAQGRKVLLVAADTFRAAAIEQLGVWAERTGADIVKHGSGADPAAVVFDGLRAAVARKADVVIVDTAGRLHTRTPLMDELRKIRRTVERELPGAPHEVLLVLDATTGQNALSQAKAFLEAVTVTGVIVTKLDGTAKGGMVLAIGRELALPVRYVGVGEGVDDLQGFDPDEFVEGLLGGC